MTTDSPDWQTNIGGSVTALSNSASMVGSPHDWASTPGSYTFTWPNSGGPWETVSLTYYYSINTYYPSQITVTGATTGNTYMSATADHGQWTLPISSLVEPDGVIVDLALLPAWSAAWDAKISMVASTVPQIVRPVFGPGVSGPDTLGESAVGAGGSSSLAGTGSKSNVIRVWSLWLAGAADGTADTAVAQISYGANNLLVLPIGAGTRSDHAEISFEGGLPVFAQLNPITLTLTNVTGALAWGAVAYSTDSS